MFRGDRGVGVRVVVVVYCYGSGVGVHLTLCGSILRMMSALHGGWRVSFSLTNTCVLLICAGASFSCFATATVMGAGC